MIDLWKYEYCGKVRIIDVDGKTFIGTAQEITDEEERSEEERQEIGITIESGGVLIEFYRSDIKSIEKV